MIDSGGWVMGSRVQPPYVRSGLVAGFVLAIVAGLVVVYLGPTLWWPDLVLATTRATKTPEGVVVDFLVHNDNSRTASGCRVNSGTLKIGAVSLPSVVPPGHFGVPGHGNTSTIPPDPAPKLVFHSTGIPANGPGIVSFNVSCNNYSAHVLFDSVEW